MLAAAQSKCMNSNFLTNNAAHTSLLALIESLSLSWVCIHALRRIRYVHTHTHMYTITHTHTHAKELI
jgi:hypothetical protein